MSGVEVAAVVPNAKPLQPLLTPTRWLQPAGAAMTTHPAADPAMLKACCATGFSSDAVALLLGPSYHPGGLRLTRRLLDSVGVGPETGWSTSPRASEPPAFSRRVTREAYVDGVDLSAANVALADGAAQSGGVSDRARFHHGDAEALPLPDAAYDAVVCECALCTFPDKATAAARWRGCCAPADGSASPISPRTATDSPPELTAASPPGWPASPMPARSTTVDPRRCRAPRHHRRAPHRRAGADDSPDLRPARTAAYDRSAQAGSRSSASTSPAPDRCSTRPRPRSATASSTTCCWCWKP